jgi:hypothetical protein
MTAVFSLFLVIGTAIPVNVSVYPNLEACQSAAKSTWSYQSRSGATVVYTAFCVQSNIIQQVAASKGVDRDDSREQPRVGGTGAAN